MSAYPKKVNGYIITGNYTTVNGCRVPEVIQGWSSFGAYVAKHFMDENEKLLEEIDKLKSEKGI